jgi:hypothetical protein
MQDARQRSATQPESLRAGRVAAVTTETLPLAAWRLRGDWSKRDGLWRAAAWCASAIDRKDPRARTRDFERAAEIVAGDAEAGFAVVELLRVRSPKGDGLSAPPSIPDRPFAGSWARFT